jgi:hypothetical protein
MPVRLWGADVVQSEGGGGYNRRSGVCALVTPATKWVTAPGYRQHPFQECRR